MQSYCTNSKTEKEKKKRKNKQTKNREKQQKNTQSPTLCPATRLTIVGPHHAVLGTGVVLGVELDARVTTEALHQGGSGARLARLVTLPAQTALLVRAVAA